MGLPMAGNCLSTFNNMARNTNSLELTAANSEYAYRENADCNNLGEGGGNSPSLFSAWIYPNDDSHRIICAMTKGFDEFSAMPDGGYAFEVKRQSSGILIPNVVIFRFNGVNYTAIELTPSATGFAPDQWTHVGVYLYTTGSGPYTVYGRFYVNGTLFEEVSDSWSISTPYSTSGQRFTVGAVKATDDSIVGYWDGKIDELFVDRPGSASAADSNIASNYRKCTAPGTSHWRFDNDLTDDGSDGNDLIGVNTPTYSSAAFSCFSPKACMIL